MRLLVRYFLIGLCVVCSCELYAQSLSTLTLNVIGVKNSNGSIRAALFQNDKDFLKNPSYGEIVKASSDTVIIVFKEIPFGDYGISVIHDENNNGVLDTNFVGIPKEGFGFGNDALGTFGPPSFDKAKISIRHTDVTHTLRMRYF
jgi:uncharacterized protein (DUF2141 family)